jgi:S-adenosylmethionine hydrolase
MRAPAMVVAFLSDFDLNDPYVGVAKAVLLAINPHLTIIDITHGIPPCDIQRGAFVLRESYKYFPKGTIFLTVVDPGVGGKRAGIVFEAGGYFFVAPDNGLLGLIIKEHKKWSCFCLKNEKFFRKPVSSTFHARDIFAPVAAQISLGVKPFEFGPPHLHPIGLDFPLPKSLSDHEIQGEIIHIDGFGNLITNIQEADIKPLLKKEKVQAKVKNHVFPFMQTYSDVSPGALLALTGSSGFIEISTNQGNASKTLGISVGEKIRLTGRQANKLTG